MKIKLSDKLKELFQICIETIDSYTDPQNPKVVLARCLEFIPALESQPNLIFEMPCYLALALFHGVKFNDPKMCISQINNQEFVPWQNIQVRKACATLLKDVKKKDEVLAQMIVIVAFYLSHPDLVQVKGAKILRFIEVPDSEKGGEENEWTEI
jgi:hypothetical protein